MQGDNLSYTWWRVGGEYYQTRSPGPVLRIKQLGDHKSTDTLLKLYADAADVAVISVGYRLAPEDPFPSGPEDCIDAGQYLMKNSEKEYGGPLRFIGGEVCVFLLSR